MVLVEYLKRLKESFKVLYLEVKGGSTTRVLLECGIPAHCLFPCNHTASELDGFADAFPGTNPVVGDIYEIFKANDYDAVWFDTMGTWLRLEEGEQNWNGKIVPDLGKSPVVAVTLSCRGVNGGAGFFANELQVMMEKFGGRFDQGVREYSGRSGKNNMIFGCCRMPQSQSLPPAAHYFLKLLHVPLSNFSEFDHRAYGKVENGQALVGRVTGWTLCPTSGATLGLVNYMSKHDNFFQNSDDENPLTLEQIRLFCVE